MNILKKIWQHKNDPGTAVGIIGCVLAIVGLFLYFVVIPRGCKIIINDKINLNGTWYQTNGKIDITFMANSKIRVSNGQGFHYDGNYKIIENAEYPFEIIVKKKDSEQEINSIFKIDENNILTLWYNYEGREKPSIKCKTFITLKK